MLDTIYAITKDFLVISVLALVNLPLGLVYDILLWGANLIKDIIDLFHSDEEEETGEYKEPVKVKGFQLKGEKDDID